MRVMVTGGTGTVGVPIVRALRASGHDVLVYASSGAESSVAPIARGDVLDATRLSTVIGGFRPEVLVHAAAMTPDPQAEVRTPDRILEVNAIGPLRVLSALAEAGGRRFVQISSIAAYGDAVERSTALREQIDDGHPRNMYELSKATAESAVLRLGHLRGVEVTCLRVGDVFGPGEKQTPYRSTLSGPSQVTALAAAGTAVRLPTAGRREWIHTADVAAGVELVVETPRPLPEVMNMSSGYFWTLADWCRILQGHWPCVRFEVDADEPNVTLHSENPPLDCTRLKDLGFDPRWDLAAALDDYGVSWEESNTHA